MQIVGVILVLISVGTIVGPIGAVAFTYRDNLVQLVVPPQINDIMNGNSSFLFANTTNNDNKNGNTGDGDDFGNVGIIAPTIVDVQIDNVSRTFTLTVNFTNPLNMVLTLNQFSAGVICSEHNFPLGSVQLSQPVDIGAGQNSLLTISGLWTQDAENHFTTAHEGDSSIDSSLVNVGIDVNGITIQEAGPISIGSVPMS